MKVLLIAFLATLTATVVNAAAVNVNPGNVAVDPSVLEALKPTRPRQSIKSFAEELSSNPKTTEEKRAIARSNFRMGGNTKTDAQLNAELDEIAAYFKEKNAEAAQHHAMEGQTMDTGAPLPSAQFDTFEGVPKSFDILNIDMRDYTDEADMVYTVEQIRSMKAEEASGSRKKRKTLQPGPTWPTDDQGYIAYWFDPSIEPARETVIRNSMQFWQDNVCIRFQQATTADPDALYFFTGSGCYSYIGRIGGNQSVSIGSGCEYLGIATHEIGHALGFFHEQSRYDRDNYVTVRWQYITPGYENNFAMATTAQMMPFTVPYDYGSVMHYSALSFSNTSGQFTLLSKDSRYQRAMGQRKAPSFYDVREMNDFFGCRARCASFSTVCQNGGYMDPKDCTKCKCPSGFGGNFCESVPPAENAVCGGILTATTAPQTLTASVGTNDFNDAIQNCYWHIQSTPGTVIEVNVTVIAGACSDGCFYNYLELKMGNPVGLINGINIQSPYEGSGYRFCCPEDATGASFISTTNLVPVIAYGNLQSYFSFTYREVAPTTSTSTTTTTTVPTTTKATTTKATTKATTKKPCVAPAWNAWSPAKRCGLAGNLVYTRTCKTVAAGCPSKCSTKPYTTQNVGWKLGAKRTISTKKGTKELVCPSPAKVCFAGARKVISGKTYCVR